MPISEDTIMPHFSPDRGGAARSSSAGSCTLSAATHPLSQAALDWQIALRRTRLAALEAEMVAACEAAAIGTHRLRPATVERDHWDRPAWHRYLAAAMRLEGEYGPRMRHLRREIAQLERLADLAIGV